MKRNVMLIGMLGLGISVAQSQTLENSWENSLEGWTTLEVAYTNSTFSTTTGVTAGTYSWKLGTSGVDYGAALQGPSSTALTALLANAGSVQMDVLTTPGDFGWGMQWDLVVHQPSGIGDVSVDGYTYNQSPVLGSESTLTFAIPAAIRAGLAAHPSLAAYLTFQIGGGGGGTMYLDYLRILPLGLLDSWEVSLEGWTNIDEPGIWTSGGLSTTTGVTAGLYSWQLTAGSSPDYGTAVTGPSSTALTALLANSASVSLDINVPNPNDFGQYHYMQWDLTINQPGGLGTGVSVTTNNYTGNANVGGQATMTWTIPQAIRSVLLSNPTLPCSLSLKPGSCCATNTLNAGGTIYLDNLRATLLPPTQANLWVRELWDDIGGEEIPANSAVTDDSSSVGFAASPWVVNPAEVNNCSLMAFRSTFFPEPQVGATAMGLPGSLDGFVGAMVQENSGFGFFGGNTFWSDGDFMTRQLTPDNYINFQAAGDYWFSMSLANATNSPFAQYVVFPASGWCGLGFADGSTTNADFVAIGVTGRNVWLGPTNTSAYHGDTNVSKALYISQGTLGQPGDTNTTIYNPLNDPNADPVDNANQYSQTNFSGGPYHINAYGDQTVGHVVDSSGYTIVILGHLRTHGDGTATLDAKYYGVGVGGNPWNTDLDLSTNNITWDCSYSFSFGGTMTSMLLFQNGQFPLYVFGFRASTNFNAVVGLDPGRIQVSPLKNTYVGYPINMTNLAVEANSFSFASPPAGYGTLNYQWYTNGVPIPGATSQYYNIASASTNDAGTYSCVATDPSGTYGSASNSVVITVTQLNPPIATGLQMFQGQNSFLVTLNEPNLTGAADTNHYVFSGGIVATGVNVINTATATEVQVLTTPLPVGTRITLTISGLTNVVGGVLATTNFTFWTDLIRTGVANWDAWLCPPNEINFDYFNTWVPANPYPLIQTNQILTSWEGPSSGITLNGGTGSGQDFAGRLYGWFIPPVTTNYVFFCNSDDGSRLSLSTNASSTNLFVIACETDWSPADEWTNINFYGNAARRGDGTATNNPFTINANLFVADSSVAGQSPATACLQNRSDQFIVAYYDSTGAAGGPPQATNQNWASYASSQVSAIVPLGTTNFWPFRDTNGQALITLQAGQRYFMQFEHIQNTGGYDEGVTYSIAGEPGPASPSATVLTNAVIEGFVPFAPTISIANTLTGPQITYTGVLLAGPTLSTITTQVAISSNGPSLYVPSNPTTTMFYRTSE